MARGRIPGPICGYSNNDNINDGTSCLHKSSPPGPLGLDDGNPIGGARAYVYQPGHKGLVSEWPKTPPPKRPWYNDPNHWTQGSLDLGEILGGSTCVIECLLRKYPNLFANAAVEDIVITSMAVVAGPEGGLLIAITSAGSNTMTVHASLEAFKDCVKDCFGN
jgi:hypothetical protein